MYLRQSVILAIATRYQAMDMNILESRFLKGGLTPESALKTEEGNEIAR
jgi:hypothetical protein